MIGPMIGQMLDAAAAEHEAKLRQRFFAGAEDPTPEQVAAAMPQIVRQIWKTFARELPAPHDIRALCEEHGEAGGPEIVKQRFLNFVRAKVQA